MGILLLIIILSSRVKPTLVIGFWTIGGGRIPSSDMPAVLYITGLNTYLSITNNNIGLTGVEGDHSLFSETSSAIFTLQDTVQQGW